ncbi:MAG: hypothetical protein Q9210_001383 [Variospora velana]
MSGDPNKQQGQYPPPQWDTPRGAYPIPHQPGLNYRGPQQSQAYPNPSTPVQGDMVTLPPPQHQPPPDYYRHLPYDMYPGHPQDPHRGPPPPHHMYQQHQPAPRQRTAIACRYCRRRKIRCSGFEASEDGRCTNCQRFQQECIFTPVSSHASAFVPAHTAYPHLRNAAPMPQQRGGRPLYPQGPPPAIYGAHGQPLGMPMPGQDPNYPPHSHGYPPMPSPAHPYPGPMYDDRGPPQPGPPKDQVSRKRPRSDESPNPPAVHPPPPPPSHEEESSHPYHHEQGRPAAPSGRRGSGGGYEYPDPTGLVPVSPASSVTSYQSAPYAQPPGQQPYYPGPSQPPPRRASPQSSSYSYEQGSPHGSTSSASAYNYAGLHPPQVLPPRDSGRTPPPKNKGSSSDSSGQRGKMGIHDLLGPGEQSGGRTSADSSMVKALNRKGM